MIVVILSFPRLGGEKSLLDEWAVRGLLHTVCFSCDCLYGSWRENNRKRSTKMCKFLGDISYPVYITHYPLIYTYTAWVCNNNATLAEGIPYMILTFAGSFILAYACLKLYDEPIRSWLTNQVS